MSIQGQASTRPVAHAASEAPKRFLVQRLEWSGPQPPRHVHAAPQPTSGAENQPGWFHAAGRAPVVAIGVVGGTYFLLGLGSSGGVLTFLLALVIWPCFMRAILRWGAAPANAPQGKSANNHSAHQSAPALLAITATPGWRLLRAYLRAVLAYATTLYVLQAIAQGLTPMSGLWFRLQLLIPLSYFALIMLAPLRWGILAMIRVIQSLGLRRGIADSAIGAVFGCGVAAMSLSVFLSKGTMPTSRELLLCVFEVVAGAAAGFEFWRGVGSPGVAPGTASLFARFKNGVMRGLRYRL